MTSDFDQQEPGQSSESQGEREIVDLEFRTLRDFRQEMAPRLALDGMFVSTIEPLARGTKVRFRFVLPEEFILAQGDAIVAWRRTQSTHPDHEPGMCLWFDDLEKQCMDIVQELVDIQKTSGDGFFDSRRGAGEVGNFVANEFAGSFAPTTDLIRRGIVKEPDAPESENLERDAAPDTDAPLPEWLSEAEKQHNVESETRREVPSEETRDFAEADPPPGGEEGFEVSLMEDDSEPDVTPLGDAMGTVADLEVLLGDDTEEQEQSSPRRLWPLAGLVVVLLAVAAGVVWWTVFRPQGPPVEEVQQTVEAEPTVAAIVLLDDSDTEPVATPIAVAEEEPPPSVAEVEKAPATRVIDVAVARLGDATVVGIRGNGDFEDSRLQVSVLPDPSRVLVRIAEIETFYRPNEIEVGSSEVVRVRVGHHPEQTPAKLYVVLDLAEDAVVVRDTSVVGDTIRIVVGRE